MNNDDKIRETRAHATEKQLQVNFEQAILNYRFSVTQLQAQHLHFTANWSPMLVKLP